METRPFDPAEYLDTEEAIVAYLAEARADEVPHATEVAARARAMIKARQARPSKSAASRA